MPVLGSVMLTIAVPLSHTMKTEMKTPRKSWNYPTKWVNFYGIFTRIKKNLTFEEKKSNIFFSKNSTNIYGIFTRIKKNWEISKNFQFFFIIIIVLTTIKAVLINFRQNLAFASSSVVLCGSSVAIRINWKPLAFFSLGKIIDKILTPTSPVCYAHDIKIFFVQIHSVAILIKKVQKMCTLEI